mmetsp:Transcript_22293/g.64803  ORF Transcript_22293/g.64803 Transcript_22293/m.64803 type:complete len:256 (-) Transcript_22293:46-813(-)
MLEPRGHTFNDALGFLPIRWCVLGQSVQDEDLSPLGALVERRKKLLQHRCGHHHHIPAARFLDLVQGCDGICHDGRVRVPHSVPEHLQKTTFFHHVRSNVVEFGHANGGRLAHVRVIVREASLEGLAEVLSDPFHSDAAHGADGKGSDERVRVIGVLHECVHSQQCRFRLSLGIIDQVKVHKLLQLNVVRLDAVHHVREEGRHVLTHGHVRDDLLHRVHLFLAVRGVDLHPELVDLALLGRREKAPIASAGVLLP